MTIPTKLIILRVALIPVFLALFFIGAETARWAALAVFAIASITDFFDGRIARRRDQVTNFYTFGDPLADKLLICSALIALVSTQSIPAWFAILIVCRDFIITGLRLVAATQNIVA
ncbi:MAG: CDP-alcohol phosphatidyltransferase family protein, partial [Proteobacteria bacterium]|nr:CDP-alcohol phosphatidyltransferase family protein [Pseudomonadota bacterium]